MTATVRPRFKLSPALATILQTSIELTLPDMFEIPVHCDTATTGRGMVIDEPYAAGVIDMKQKHDLCGLFIAVFDLATVQDVLSVFGAETTPDPAVVHDAVEEITNMIFGQIKKRLNEGGYGFEMALPKIIANKAAFCARHADHERILLPFFANGHACFAAIMATR